MTKIMGDAPSSDASAERREFVSGMAGRYSQFVNATPRLLSALYDVDLLPEQLLHVLEVNPPAAAANAARFGLICELWKRPFPQTSKSEADSSPQQGDA